MNSVTSIARRWPVLTAALLLLALVLLSGHSRADTFISAYSSDAVLPKGMVIRLTKADKTKVEAATADDLKAMFGVVVDFNDAPANLSISGQATYVATQGKYQVLVSNQNGAIKSNDFISLSSAKGIASKATNKQAFILGRAVDDFDGKTNVISNNNGQALGRIQVEIAISKNPIQKSDKNFLPEFLQKTAEAVAGKPVQPAKIYASLVLILTAGFISGSLLYAGVRNALISIGRNPLGRKGIIRGLFQVVLVSLIIFILGVFGVYLLVKL